MKHPVKIKVELGIECGAGAKNLQTVWEGLDSECPWYQFEGMANSEGMVLLCTEIDSEI